MDQVYDICCGIDVHKKLIVACLRSGEKTELREFGGTTKKLLEMTDWLIQAGCKMTAMESTASYWKPVYNVLESVGIPVMVVNAQHMKAVPGRKTDAKDAEWIADLLQHGLLKASFIPSKAQRELRELVRYRKSLVEDRASEMNRFQKMLEGANIKLSGTVTNINGKSSRNILNVIVNGDKFDAAKYDEMIASKEISSGLKATKEQLIDDLEGVLTPIQRKMLKELLSHVDELSRHIQNLNDEISNFMSKEEHEAAKEIQQIPGIGEISSETIISVIGTDMSRFPSGKHLASWAGVCPGNNESAGKRRPGKTRRGNQVLRTTLINCAWAAVKNSKSFFYAQYRRLSAHLGKKRAIVAVTHSILIAIYHVLAQHVPFVDLGSNYYNQFNRERKAASMVRKLKELGYVAIVTDMIAT